MRPASAGIGALIFTAGGQPCLCQWIGAAAVPAKVFAERITCAKLGPGGSEKWGGRTRVPAETVHFSGFEGGAAIGPEGEKTFAFR